MGQKTGDNRLCGATLTMLGRVNHIALAVPDLAAAVARYQNTLGAKVSERQELPDHGVAVVFVDLGNTKVELLEAWGETSPIAAFMTKNPSGGMHHICYEVADIQGAKDHLMAEGARVLGDIKIGAHGNPVLFLHPKDFDGTLIELEQVTLTKELR